MHIPVHNLWWLAASGTGYGARYVKLRWQAVRGARLDRRERDPTPELLELRAAYGYNEHALVSITPGARLWSSPGIKGAIIYSEFGRVWLAAGDPLAAEEDIVELARRFIGAAKLHGRVAAFVPATSRFAKLATKPLKLGVVKVGASPYFDLRNWSPRGDRAKKMRAGVNQARRASVQVEAIKTVDERLRQETARLCRRWLDTRRTATTFGWLFVLDPFQHGLLKKFYVARDADGRAVGFLAASPMPARDGWYLEDVLRHPEAPPGTADLLVVEALTRLAADGARLATLGTSPLAKDGEDVAATGNYPLIERTLRIVASRMGRFYNFEGLRRFKGKFVPSWWESEYVMVPRGMTIPPRVAYAIVRAIAPGGVAQLLTRQIAHTVRVERDRL